MAKKILEIKGLKKQYNDQFHLDVDDLFLEQNRILTLIGPNGSGKSTIIRLLNLLENPDDGTIYFDGKDILRPGTDKAAVRKKMAVVFQEPLLFNTSVYNNIIMGLNFRKVDIKSIKDRLDFFIGKLKITNILKRNVKDLSGGEKQRVSLARALVLDPRILLLDEPLANIDQQSREDLREDLFALLKKYGKSIIYVTHDRNEAMVLADYLAVLNEGKIEQFDQKEEVFRRPANEFIARFVGVETLVRGRVLESRGNVVEVEAACNGGKKSVYAAGKARKGSKVTISIRPEDVILYSMDIPPQKSSAMNIFKGQVISVKETGMFKKIEINCGFILTSFVTQDSIERLGLKKGLEITAGIKASSIHIF
jgi:tungstate transport system ATP-binding protein